MEQVVITGTGLISPLGNDVDTFWRRLVGGESGISPIVSFDAARHKVRIAGAVRDFDPQAVIGSKEARRMDRFCHFALAAAEQAVREAELQLDRIDRERMGVYVGSGIGGIQTLMQQADLSAERGPSRVSPTLVPMMIPNMAAALISIRYGALGPSLAPVTACSIGNTAIGEAFHAIRSGRADVILAGGAEAALTDIALASFANATALSARNDEPQRASRPFDANRDGFVIAEGAGILVLESRAHAMRRGAGILGEVIGYGASSDAYHMVATPPDGDGAARAMRLALTEAGLSPDELDVISAHATSTVVGDRSETAAIKRVLGGEAYRIPITANKSMTGHMLGASGAVEAIALLRSLREQCIPPTVNLDTPDPACDLDYVPNEARKAGLRYGMSNSFGFGGHNSAIVLKASEA
ncbi:beta-ketoacyl-ACP synthase II [Paenibacillus sp. IB182496]|uniref:3-oxoacyl-[acyl-carrier-protein] synthase 2 n=1 Tax=Paenibacillus sabuli TaxID=2772509 RepID=A0A927BQX0_9BACL|nr:beta-ketoacyl-ACP synthase II [Paenibacillus sabuli]MBD2845098.1 beta-ketoacyl-ACP synthase II [Paenibacillus sabuli]